MKTVRKEMNAGELKGIIDLPGYSDNQRVEITVAPAKKFVHKLREMNSEEIEAALNKLEGCLKGLADPTKNISDWREERLAERYGIKFAD